MKPCTPEAINYFLSPDYSPSTAELYTIFAKSGTIRIATGSKTINFSGDDYLCPSESSIDIGRGEIENSAGFEVQRTKINIYHDEDSLINGAPVPELLSSGRFDGARIRIESASLIPEPYSSPPSWHAVVIFDGFIGRAMPGISMTEVECESISRVFDRPFPPQVLSPKCPLSFGSYACGVNRDALSVTASVQAGSNRTTVRTGITSKPGNYFKGGFLDVGGVKREIAMSAADGAMVLAIPLPAHPQAGAAVTCSPTCARTREACAGWGNSVRFRGAPWVPTPETAI